MLAAQEYCQSKFVGRAGDAKWPVGIRFAQFPVSLRNVEDLRAGRGIDVCHETVRF